MSSLFPQRLLAFIASLGSAKAAPDLSARLESAGEAPSGRFRVRRSVDRDEIRAWWASAQHPGEAALADDAALAFLEHCNGNIENPIGTVSLPVGVAGPLAVNGLHANGRYLLPLATSEAALVASYARGSEAINRAGGVSAALLGEGVLRAPAFVFETIGEAGSFVAWLTEHEDALRAAAKATTRHGKLEEIEPRIDADTVLLVCRYSTGDASGQNMVTIATEAMCQWIIANTPVPPCRWFIEGNFSGDKKASYLGLINGRGKKVSASVVLPESVIRQVLRTTPEDMLAYARVAQLGATLSGQIGAQGHVANGLAALFIATGQDAACVAESAVGFTRMEPREDGLFMSLTLPNLMVGTVGGGTGLPHQKAALDLMGLSGTGHARAFAEVTAGLCLAGEISIMAAIASGVFTSAHHKLARTR
ncbi:MAG: hydroxymethylglutaryl-CoA reductase [Pseudomonadota bacterium]